ncbi:Nuclear aminoacylation-dependent tRNA export pathway component [Friedmanniomyces endolithicus]|nr:Nuclear aminoacylation-dependent tRNA export pathway component [Friedmanniomyces endolithicus]KAK0797538.1 Nuclear aminoacylation-dependent tRNA export pathway component [Friedmanniomyces endolithicus]KAK0817123.1 Nuclear aminoacylation-dependent tRNA export pathway component [Friedmanniomyces endolithicus]KAK0819918.1 Nuclear aminoacylation-dependent tRNA export pathway component [Friedmanniomyces endolithicus]KAK0852844.1 Nuclear aminoacylation-dependent tRNA export pathway component [Frie
MDFLKSAVASIAKGPAFPYSFGDRVDLDQSVWTLHNGTRREDGSKCSIFSFDVNVNRNRLPLAKNALRKLRTLRHPGVVKVLDTVETDQLIYIATERLTPLTWSTKRRALSEESLKWGLHNVAKTLKFINDEASSVHGNIRASSIFTSESGEWKISGLDILSSMKEDDAIIFSQGSLVPDIGRYSPPEVAKNGWESVRKGPTHAVDAYQYGILISEVFNGGFSGTDQIGSTKSIPLAMQVNYKRLTHAVPKMRLSVAHFLEQGSRSGCFFETPLIQLTNGIDNLGLKSETEKDAFLSELEAVAESDDFPEDFFKVKVLPELLKSVEFGGGGPKSFALVMRIATKLSEDEYDSQMVPVIVRLFSSPDRAMRVCLLDNLPLMIDHLSQKIVTDKIFPQMVTGFGDLAPIVREQTVKAVLVIVPKLSDRIINGELLRHLAKTANDEQPGIRTNTTICLGKMARNLGAASRAKVLSAAFSRSLRDPFMHARNAALMALAATADVFSEDDCATKMLPAICPSLVDKEKVIRDQANKTLNIYLERVRKFGQTLPDTVLPPPSAGSSVPGTRSSTPQSITGNNQWMGWAISSFKIGGATGEIQPNSNGVKPTPLERAAGSPSANGSTPRPSTRPATSASVVPQVASGLRHSAPSPPDAESEDFGNDDAGWGDLDDEHEDHSIADAWGEAPTPDVSRPSTASHASKPSTASNSTTYDDGGEPDFEGWLNAQAAAKLASKRPLPKGLAAAKKVAPAPAPAPARKTAGGVKAVVPKAAAKAKEEEDDGWGDAWG